MNSDHMYDVGIIGAGPAGSIASYYLSKAGLSVLLLEKDTLPRYKTCGGGVVFRARSIIPELHPDIIDREFYNIDWGIKNDGFSYRVERPFPIISMVMRERFDKHIVDCAVKQGTTLLENTRLEDLSINGSATINCTKGIFSSRIIIGADGALSPTSKMAGIADGRYLIPALEAEVQIDRSQFERHKDKVRFDVDAIPGGYGWVFPKRSHLSVGIASEKRGGVSLRKAYTDYIESLGISDIQSEEIHGFMIPIRSRKGFCGKRVILTGDAAGLADPLVAEGISHALISGKLAAESIIEGNLDPEKIHQIYPEKLRVSLLGQTRTGRLLSHLFYNYPRLRKSILTRKGQQLTEYFTDVFSGVRRYPESFRDISRAILKAII